MNTRAKSFSTSQIAFWGISLIAVIWIVATIFFEIHLGFPGSGIQWAKRLVGWGVEAMFIRALMLGARRQYPR